MSKNNEIEDFTMQYSSVFDKGHLTNEALKIAIPLKEGYVQSDIHTLNIRTDYGHENIEGKIKHTNIDVLDVFNNKINANDDKSFITQNFVQYLVAVRRLAGTSILVIILYTYTWYFHYILYQTLVSL